MGRQTNDHEVRLQRKHSEPGRREGGRKNTELSVLIRGKKLDVSDWAHKHPGGNKVFRVFSDRDATEVFDSYHSRDAHAMLDRMLRTAPDAPGSAVQPHKSDVGAAFAELTSELRREGLFTPCWADEIGKLFWVLIPWAVGAAMLRHDCMPVVGMLLFTFACYLSGWVSHDWLHHSAAKTSDGWSTEPSATAGNGVSKAHVWWGDVVGYALGWVQGYEELWWKARHNTHHVCTNEHGSDPDIKTSPVLVYVRSDPRIAKALNAVQRWQQWYFLPVFLLFDFYWRAESLVYLAVRLPKPRMVARLGLMGLHYAFLLWVFEGRLQLLAVFSALRGFLTGVVVFATHYGEDILSDEEARAMSLVQQTSRTSCNIAGGRIANFLTGYISLQIEHHLWPMMPTGHLEKAQARTRRFFQKHGLEYREANIIGCVGRNIRALGFRHLL